MCKKAVSGPSGFPPGRIPITDPLLDRIDGFAVRTVEIGAQSMNDNGPGNEPARAQGRAHPKGRGPVAGQGAGDRHPEMVGLPGQSRKDALETGRQIIDLSPDFVRIYPLVVLAASPLARGYAAGKYRPLPLQEAVSLVCDLYTLFEAPGDPRRPNGDTGGPSSWNKAVTSSPDPTIRLSATWSMRSGF